MQHFDKTILLNYENIALFEIPFVGEMTIGNSASSNFIIKMEDVAPNHCKIIDREGTLYLQDMGSGMATGYQGDVLQTGESIAIGNGTIQVGSMEFDMVLNSYVPDNGVKRCPRCNRINGVNATFCRKCACVLSDNDIIGAALTDAWENTDTHRTSLLSAEILASMRAVDDEEPIKKEPDNSITEPTQNYVVARTDKSKVEVDTPDDIERSKSLDGKDVKNITDNDDKKKKSNAKYIPVILAAVAAIVVLIVMICIWVLGNKSKNNTEEKYATDPVVIEPVATDETTNVDETEATDETGASETEESTEATETSAIDTEPSASEPTIIDLRQNSNSGNVSINLDRISIADRTYSGEAICPGFSVYYSVEDRDLISDAESPDDYEYTFVYRNNIRPGEAVIYVEGNGTTVIGEREKTYDIVVGDPICDNRDYSLLVTYVLDVYENAYGRLPSHDELVTAVNDIVYQRMSAAEFVNAIIMSPEFIRDMSEDELAEFALQTIRCYGFYTPEERTGFIERVNTIGVVDSVAIVIENYISDPDIFASLMGDSFSYLTDVGEPIEMPDDSNIPEESTGIAEGTIEITSDSTEPLDYVIRYEESEDGAKFSWELSISCSINYSVNSNAINSWDCSNYS